MSSGNYSHHTITLYDFCLRDVVRVLENPEVEEITSADLVRFMAYMKNEYVPKRKSGDSSPLSGSSLDNRWKAIRTFFAWAEQVLQTRRPDLDLKRPKYRSAETTPFSSNEVRQILEACEFSKEFQRRNTKPYKIKRRTALRDKVIILTLLDTGLRVGELCRLDVQDVDLKDGEILITPFGTGKKTKPRLVFIAKTTRRALWLYLSKMREIYYPEDPLFGVTPTAVRLMLSKIGKRTGISPIYPHRFRHTFAIQYIRNGGDIFTLQRILGHSTLDMVKKYLALADQETKKAHLHASPVDRWRLR